MARRLGTGLDPRHVTPADLKRSEDFFGVSPVRFVDDVYNCTAQYIKVSPTQLPRFTIMHSHSAKLPARSRAHGGRCLV